MKIAVIQLNAQKDKALNVRRAFDLMTKAVAEHQPDLIVLPENFTCYSTDPQIMAENAEPFPSGPTYKALADFAQANRVAIHAGSMSEAAGDKPYNTSVVFDKSGQEIARYRKIHRFDITAPDGTSYFESDVVGGGTDIVTYQLDGLTFGCAICFDLRFAELFRALTDRGADVIVIPSAFTHSTGKAHWETLIRARAIETQCYMIAPNQFGTYDDGSKSNWGHSMIVEPWGTVLATAGNGEEIIIAELDRRLIETARNRIPISNLRVLT